MILARRVRLLTWIGLYMLQVLFNQNRSLKRTPGEFALRVSFGVLRWGSFLFFDAYKHFREKEAF